MEVKIITSALNATQSIFVKYLASNGIRVTIQEPYFLIDQLSNFKAIGLKGYQRLTIGEIGCEMAHRKAWDTDNSGLIVLEDDFHVENCDWENFVELCENLVSNNTLDDSIIMLGSSRMRRNDVWFRNLIFLPSKIINFGNIKIHRNDIIDRTGTVGYYIGAMAQRKLLLSNLIHVADDWSAKRQYGIDIYYVARPLVWEQNEFSLTGNGQEMIFTFSSFKRSIYFFTCFLKSFFRFLRSIFWH